MSQINISKHEISKKFIEVMAASGLSGMPNIIEANSGVHRFGPKNVYWCLLFECGGCFGDWRTDRSEKFSIFKAFNLKTDHTQRKELASQMRKSQEMLKAAKAAAQNKAKDIANQEWVTYEENGKSSYLEKKQVESYSLRYGKDKYGSFVVVPLRDIHEKLWNIQKIYAPKLDDSNNKWFLTDGAIRSHFHVIGSLDSVAKIYVAEGYVTGASVHMANETTVVIAFNSGNLAPVIEVIRGKFPDLEIVIAADNDCWKEDGKNPGLDAANKAAKKYGCSVVSPTFKEEHHHLKPTDFNDLHILEGLEEVKRQINTKLQSKTAELINNNPKTIAIGILDFLNYEFPPREMILAPIIPEKGIVMLYAPRGIGKTWVSAEIAYTVASGSQMFDEKWKCEKLHKVLFVDGEMPASVLQERFASIALSKKALNQPENDYLTIISADVCENGIPDLSTLTGQDFIESYLADVKLLILDNISALCNSGRENETESWKPMQDWFLSLRRRGISVIFIHHTGKNGNQRGNSKKEDVLDTVIALRRPKDYEMEQGARFEVHYEKSRGFYNDDAKPFEAHKNHNDSRHSFWEVKDLENSMAESIAQLKKDGLTQREIAKELDIGLATVNRALKKITSKSNGEAS